MSKMPFSFFFWPLCFAAGVSLFGLNLLSGEVAYPMLYSILMAAFLRERCYLCSAGQGPCTLVPDTRRTRPAGYSVDEYTRKEVPSWMEGGRKRRCWLKNRVANHPKWGFYGFLRVFWWFLFQRFLGFCLIVCLTVFFLSLY